MSVRMRGWSLVAGLVVASANTSHAEVSALASASYGQARLGDSYDEYGGSWSVQGDVGARLGEFVAIGGHVGIGSKSTYTHSDARAMFDQAWNYSYRPVQLGLSAQLALGKRGALVPWVGVQNGMQQQECSYFFDKRIPGGKTTIDCTPQNRQLDFGKVAVGLSIAVDAWTFDDKSRISIVGSAIAARGDTTYEEDRVEPYRAVVWLGVGYRFWQK